MKICTKCGISKDYSEFTERVKGGGVLRSHCKDCVKEYTTKNKERISKKHKEYYEKNRDACLNKSKNYYKHNQDNINKYRKEYRSTNKYKFVEGAWKHAGIKNFSMNEYLKMHDEQNGCCLVCGKSEEELGKRLVPDHNHSTGEVRGLLCGKCNTAFGLLSEDLNIIQGLIEYRKKFM